MNVTLVTLSLLLVCTFSALSLHPMCKKVRAAGAVVCCLHQSAQLIGLGGGILVNELFTKETNSSLVSLHRDVCMPYSVHASGCLKFCE
jgi:hypothetical protein